MTSSTGSTSSGDGAVELKMRGSFVVSAYTAVEQPGYHLRDSFILDSGANIHICNDRKQLQNFQPATEDDTVYVGNAIVPIKRFEDIAIMVQTP